MLHRILNARQFGLKMIANVSYGYTSAGFSGRMPCAEIADAIVQSGRQTLENAIRMVRHACMGTSIHACMGTSIHVGTHGALRGQTHPGASAWPCHNGTAAAA